MPQPSMTVVNRSRTVLQLSPDSSLNWCHCSSSVSLPPPPGVFYPPNRQKKQCSTPQKNRKLSRQPDGTGVFMQKTSTVPPRHGWCDFFVDRSVIDKLSEGSYPVLPPNRHPESIELSPGQLLLISDRAAGVDYQLRNGYRTGIHGRATSFAPKTTKPELNGHGLCPCFYVLRRVVRVAKTAHHSESVSFHIKISYGL